MIVTVKHNFETAHRLPFLAGKCENIHGHSWWVEWEFDNEMDDNGLTLEYGALKRALRSWVDEHLDHGTMLGAKDKLLEAFRKDGSKVYIFGEDYTEFPWPTVEAVSSLLASVAIDLIGVEPISVKVQETHVNAAVWRVGHDRA